MKNKTEEQIKQFAQELLELCRKHKVNVECSENFYIGSDQYEVTIWGAWDVSDPVEIYKIKPAKKIL